MTKKNYVALAAAIKSKLPVTVVSVPDASFRFGVEATAHAIADVLALDNPKFERDRFLEACGVYRKGV